MGEKIKGDWGQLVWEIVDWLKVWGESMSLKYLE